MTLASHIKGYLATTPNHVTAMVDGHPRPLPRPFGRVHARRLGDDFTACGEPVINWSLFWELPFPLDVASCPSCVVGVRREGARAAGLT